MNLVIYYAYGKELKKVTKLTINQVEFMLNSICETGYIVNFTKIRLNSKHIKLLGYFEDELSTLADSIPEVMTAYVNLQYID